MKLADPRQEIATVRAEWIAAINASDADAFVRALTQDAVWLPAGQPAIHTSARIRDWLLGPFEKFAYRYTVSQVCQRLAGEWAAERAAFESEVREKGGGTARLHRGTWTMLWRHTPEGWRIDRYIDHTGWE